MEQTQMYILIYTSKFSGLSQQVGPILEIIEQQARPYNLTHNLTSLLFYQGQSFIQLIEGEQLAIKRLYRKLEADERHRDLQIIDYRPITKRHFSNVPMKVFNLSGGYNRLELPFEEFSLQNLLNCQIDSREFLSQLKQVELRAYTNSL